MSAIFKGLAIASLVIGVSAISFAQKSTGSITKALENASVVNNNTASKSSSNGGHSGGNSGSTSGGHSGSTGGHNPPPNCVPEPASMLILGAGAGFMAWKRRRAAKA
jgi:hypothetical protein